MTIRGALLGWTLLACILSGVVGQAAVTTPGKLSSATRALIKNQMRSILSGRKGYIPILSYLRVRGGSIANASPARAPQSVPTASPTQITHTANRVPTGNRFRWMYVVPNANRWLTRTHSANTNRPTGINPRKLPLATRPSGGNSVLGGSVSVAGSVASPTQSSSSPASTPSKIVVLDPIHSSQGLYGRERGDPLTTEFGDRAGQNRDGSLSLSVNSTSYTQEAGDAPINYNGNRVPVGGGANLTGTLPRERERDSVITERGDQRQNVQNNAGQNVNTGSRPVVSQSGNNVQGEREGRTGTVFRERERGPVVTERGDQRQNVQSNVGQNVNTGSRPLFSQSRNNVQGTVLRERERGPVVTERGDQRQNVQSNAGQNVNTGSRPVISQTGNNVQGEREGRTGTVLRERERGPAVTERGDQRQNVQSNAGQNVNTARITQERTEVGRNRGPMPVVAQSGNNVQVERKGANRNTFNMQSPVGALPPDDRWVPPMPITPAINSPQTAGNGPSTEPVVSSSIGQNRPSSSGVLTGTLGGQSAHGSRVNNQQNKAGTVNLVTPAGTVYLQTEGRVAGASPNPFPDLTSATVPVLLGLAPGDGASPPLPPFNPYNSLYLAEITGQSTQNSGTQQVSTIPSTATVNRNNPMPNQKQNMPIPVVDASGTTVMFVYDLQGSYTNNPVPVNPQASVPTTNSQGTQVVTSSTINYPLADNQQQGQMPFLLLTTPDVQEVYVSPESTAGGYISAEPPITTGQTTPLATQASTGFNRGPPIVDSGQQLNVGVGWNNYPSLGNDNVPQPSNSGSPQANASDSVGIRNPNPSLELSITANQSVDPPPGNRGNSVSASASNGASQTAFVNSNGNSLIALAPEVNGGTQLDINGTAQFSTAVEQVTVTDMMAPPLIGPDGQVLPNFWTTPASNPLPVNTTMPVTNQSETTTALNVQEITTQGPNLTTTPFGLLNTLCGPHLVGTRDFPTTTTTSTQAPPTTTTLRYRFPWLNPLHPEYEPPEPSEAPELEMVPQSGGFRVAPVAPPLPPLTPGMCFCSEKPECEGLGATRGLPYENQCDIAGGLTCCCEPS